MATDWLWWRDGVIYQVYVRSFKDSNGDGLGDLQGVTGKLDYLKELGVNAIWLSPFYPTPDVDYGYDISDHAAVDPRFGTLADFDKLLKEAQQRGIRIILDIVLNHTSDQHPWFQASKQSRDNPFADWYLWRDAKGGRRPPNNWLSMVGGSGWKYSPERGQYYFHMFYPEQPDLNWRNPAVRKAYFEMMRFWLERGVDGFRLDVFNLLFKDAEFRNNPRRFGLKALVKREHSWDTGLRPFDWQEHIYDCDQPELKEILGELRSLMDGYPERFLVGETFLPTPEKAADFTGLEMLHTTFELNLLTQPWKPAKMLRAIQRWDEALPPDAQPTQVLNNHDTVRSATRFKRGGMAGDARADERLKVAAAMMLTLRGTPFIYYGEEIGMRDIDLRRDQILDPVGKKLYPLYKGRDGSRSPMQWDGTLNSGFSSGKPWLPVHPGYRKRNIANQQADPQSLWNFYRRLIQLRSELPALRRGMFLAVTYYPVRLLAYLRQTTEQTVLVALNFSRRRTRLFLGRELRKRGWELKLSNRREQVEIDGDFLRLEPEEAIILLQK